MASRREVDVPPDLRAKMAASYLHFAEMYYPGLAKGGADPGGWLRSAAALDAGEPLETRGWEFGPDLLPAGVHVYDEVRLEPDGSITRLRRWTGGSFVDYGLADG